MLYVTETIRAEQPACSNGGAVSPTECPGLQAQQNLGGEYSLYRVGGWGRVHV